jgi:hypothetical protein
MTPGDKNRNKFEIALDLIMNILSIFPFVLINLLELLEVPVTEKITALDVGSYVENCVRMTYITNLHRRFGFPFPLMRLIWNYANLLAS